MLQIATAKQMNDLSDFLRHIAGETVNRVDMQNLWEEPESIEVIVYWGGGIRDTYHFRPDTYFKTDSRMWKLAEK